MSGRARAGAGADAGDERIAYFDCRTGASGNMLLGAMIEAGVPAAKLRERLALVDLRGFSLEVTKVKRGPVLATHVEVRVADAAGEHRGHDHEDAGVGRRQPPTGRSLAEIVSLIRASGLSEGEKSLAERVFTRLAEAEAEAHGGRLQEVHFHEVGAVDAIVDVVGAAICLTELGITQVWVSPVNLGRGWVDSVHGRLPVPAPATAALIRGMAVYTDDLQGELLTPTGAAVLSTVARGTGPMPPMVVESWGCGAGTMQLTEAPNVLRVFVGRPIDSRTADVPPRLDDVARDLGLEHDECVVVEASIDDMLPEMFEHAMERAFSAGALDVTVAPVHMKKNRPAWILQALLPPDGESVGRVIRSLFENTTTFGVRLHSAGRLKLQRRSETVTTEYGTVSVKIGVMDGRPVSVSPEYDDCLAQAKRNGVPLKRVYEAASRAAASRLLP